ncbi:hypothetical protein JCM5296_001050 [Sporobolomyces johnsonii]
MADTPTNAPSDPVIAHYASLFSSILSALRTTLDQRNADSASTSATPNPPSTPPSSSDERLTTWRELRRSLRSQFGSPFSGTLRTMSAMTNDADGGARIVHGIERIGAEQLARECLDLAQRGYAWEGAVEVLGWLGAVKDVLEESRTDRPATAPQFAVAEDVKPAPVSLTNGHAAAASAAAPSTSEPAHSQGPTLTQAHPASPTSPAAPPAAAPASPSPNADVAGWAPPPPAGSLVQKKRSTVSSAIPSAPSTSYLSHEQHAPTLSKAAAFAARMSSISSATPAASAPFVALPSVSSTLPPAYDETNKGNPYKRPASPGPEPRSPIPSHPTEQPIAGSSSSTGYPPTSTAHPPLASSSIFSAPSAPPKPKKARHSLDPSSSKAKSTTTKRKSLLAKPQSEVYIPPPRSASSSRPQRERKLPAKLAWEQSSDLLEDEGEYGRNGSAGAKRTGSLAGSTAEEEEEIDELASDTEMDALATGANGAAAATGPKRFRTGAAVMAKFPNYGWWIAGVLDPATAPSTTQGKRVKGAYLVKSVPTGADHRWVAPDASSIRELDPSELDQILSGQYATPPPASWNKWRGELVEAVEIVRDEEQLKDWMSRPTDLEIRIEAEKERKRQARVMAGW